MKRTFIYADEKSNKFWSIDTNGAEFTVTYGKVGTAGQTQTKSFADEAACQKEAEKLIKEKTKKGYAEENGCAGVGAGTSETLKSGANQRYFDHEVNASVEEVLSQMCSLSDNYQVAEDFLNYYYENYTNCFVTTNGSTVTFTCCDLDDETREIEGAVDICIINPKKKEATFIPSEDNHNLQDELGDGETQITINILDELIDLLKEESKNWKGEKDGKMFPFPKLPKKPKSKFVYELPYFTVEQGNSEEMPDISSFPGYSCYIDGMQWFLRLTGKKLLRIDYSKIGASGIKARMRFKTTEEAVVTACKIVLKKMGEGLEFSDRKDFSFADVKKLVYLYEKGKQGGSASSYSFPVYDPIEHKRLFLEAIRTGNDEFVKLCLENGANPVEAVEEKKYQEVYPMEAALEANQPGVLKLLVDYSLTYNTNLGIEGQELSVLVMFARNNYQNAEEKIQMLLDCGYDCVKDSKSILMYYKEFVISEELRQKILAIVKAGLPGMKRMFIYNENGVNMFWTIETIDNTLYVNTGKVGTHGQKKTAKFDDADACQKAAEKMIAAQLSKGYVEHAEASFKTEKSAKSKPNMAGNAGQRYFNSERKSVNSMFEHMGWSQKVAGDFQEYCNTNYSDCFITTNGTTVNITFCNFDDVQNVKGDTDVCIMYPAQQKATLVPSANNHKVLDRLKGEGEISFYIGYDVIGTIENDCKNWVGENDGELLPFPAY